jgi:hypothetical protein
MFYSKKLFKKYFDTAKYKEEREPVLLESIVFKLLFKNCELV